MSRKKITTAKKEATVAKNKQRLDNLLNDTELSDVTLVYSAKTYLSSFLQKYVSGVPGVVFCAPDIVPSATRLG